MICTCSPNMVRVIKSRRMGWAEHVARLGIGNVYVQQDFGGETWEKRPLRRPRCRWEGNIKMDLQEVEFGGIDWIDLAQNMERWREIVNVIMNLWFP